MGNDPWAVAMAVLLWFGLIAYGVFAGADFGAGWWNLVGRGALAKREHGAIIRAIGPVWEANNIWLIFLVTGVFTAFPIVFSTLSVALLIPLIGALLGIVMRGAAFAYYSNFSKVTTVNMVWGRVFGGASVITPFLFGMAAGAIAGGTIHVRDGQVVEGFWSAWLTPFSFICGAFALSLSTCTAAVFLAVESAGKHDEELTTLHRRRGLLSLAVTMALGAVAFIAAAFAAHTTWVNLLTRDVLFFIGTCVVGLATGILLLLRRYRLARVGIVGTTAGVLAVWAFAQAPYMIPPDITIGNAAAEPAVMSTVFWCSIIGLAIVLPSFSYLLYIFKGGKKSSTGTAQALFEQLERGDEDKAKEHALQVQPTRALSAVTRRQDATIGRVTVAVIFMLALYALMRTWRDLHRLFIGKQPE